MVCTGLHLAASAPYCCEQHPDCHVDPSSLTGSPPGFQSGTHRPDFVLTWGCQGASTNTRHPVTAAWASSVGSLLSLLPLWEELSMLPKTTASTASLGGHQHARVLPDCQFLSLRRSHLSCHIVHVTPLGSASTCVQTLASFLVSSAGCTQLPTPTHFCSSVFFFFSYGRKSPKSVLAVSQA